MSRQIYDCKYGFFLECFYAISVVNEKIILDAKTKKLELHLIFELWPRYYTVLILG